MNYKETKEWDSLPRRSRYIIESHVPTTVGTLEELKAWLTEKIHCGDARKWRNCGSVTILAMKRFLGEDVLEPHNRHNGRTYVRSFAPYRDSKHEQAEHALLITQFKEDMRKARLQIVLLLRKCGKTMQEISEVMNLSNARVQQMCAEGAGWAKLNWPDLLEPLTEKPAKVKKERTPAPVKPKEEKPVRPILPPAIPCQVMKTKPEFGDFHQLKMLFGIPRSSAYVLESEGNIEFMRLRKRGQVKGKVLINFDSVRKFLERMFEENQKDKATIT